MRKSQERSGYRRLKVGAAALLGAVAVLAGPALPASAAAVLTLDTSQVAIAGGTILYIQNGTALLSTHGIRFVTPSTGTCPTLYSDAALPSTTVVSGGLLTALDVSTAYVATPALPAGTYKPCIYLDATSAGLYTTDALAASGTTTVTSVNFARLSPATGPTASQVTLTASSAIFTASSYSTQLVSGVTACPATFTTVGTTVLAATTSKTSTSMLTVTIPTTVTAGTPYYVCSYAGAVAGTSALAARGDVTFATYSNTLPTVALNPTGGSSGTATTVTVSLAGTSAIFTGTPDVLLSRNSCALTRPANTAIGLAAVTPPAVASFVEPFLASTTKISNSKLAVTVPTAVVVNGNEPTTAWNVCVYASSTAASALVTAPAVYTVAPVLTVSGAQFAVGSGSAGGTGAGPAQGGSTITVSGLTGIPTAAGATLSATLGGSPINNIVALDATSFSGVTSAHAAGAVKLAVTTAAGTKQSSGTPYTYTYGITVSPNTAATDTTPVLDILGAGFSSLTFTGEGLTMAASALDAGAYILLTNNLWNQQDFSVDKVALAAADTLTAVTFCNSPLVISDQEIICTLQLDDTFGDVTVDNTGVLAAGTEVTSGSYTVTIVNAITALNSASYNYSVVSSGSTFTVSPY